MNLVEQRLTVAALVSLLFLAIAVSIDRDPPRAPWAYPGPALFIENKAAEPITLLSAHVVGVPVLGAPHVIFPGQRMTVSITGAPEDLPQLWRVRWLHAGAAHQTAWDRRLEWLVIAGAHATVPHPSPCVLGGGDPIVVPWDPMRPPDLSPVNERDDFVAPRVLDDFR